MANTSLENIKIGMIVAEDVLDTNGRLLLRKGQSIEDKHLRIFKTWGVYEVNIAGQSEYIEEAQSFSKEELQSCLQQMKPFFRYTDTNHTAIRQLLKMRIMQEIQTPSTNQSEELASPEVPEIEFGEEELQTLMEHELRLPEIPTVVFELNTVLENPRSSSNDIARVVSKSPSLAAKLLELVNSPLYGYSSKIDSIPRAVTLIGTKEITTLATGISVLGIFKNIPKDIIDMSSFLKHSLACGILARILGAHKKIANTERLFVSGLLHDIGRLILYTYFPEQSRNLLYKAYSNKNLLTLTERNLFYTDHAYIGKKLAEKWNLPKSLIYNIAYHHNPMKKEDNLEPTILHIADIISHAMSMGSSGEIFVPPLVPDAWKNLAIESSFLPIAVKQTKYQLEPLVNSFN